ncbi:MAG TPA: ferrochelatase [Polyangiaceae bacterium]|nr:ferrochelatase [Polyangiaceae bacterium]
MARSQSPTDAVLLVAHGTVENLDDLPAFLARIRHGRPAPAELAREVRRRYELIGRSPLLDVTRQQARLLGERLGLPTYVGMRLWAPSVEEALGEALTAGAKRVCILPLAPFSVHVYFQAAQQSATQVIAAGGRAPELVAVAPWGENAAFVNAHARLVARHAPLAATLVLTAHSLPLGAIRGGDPYAELATNSARAIAARAGRTHVLAYQSQGAGDGEWLGPDLRTTFENLARQGVREVALSPFGFLTEHVETLYDLDVEAQGWARELGLRLTRIPAIGTDPGLIEALAEVVQRALR